MFSAYLEEHPLFPLLAPRGERIPFPPATHREAWKKLPMAARQEILAAGEAFAPQPYPMVTATQFMAFVRSGSRVAHEDPYFARRKKLMAAVLAECVAYDGAQLDTIIDGIWCICEESFWGLSAHNGSAHPGARPAHERPLPDVENPYLDLFAAQTGALLSWTCYLLGDALDQITPSLRRRVMLEVERRVIDPFFHHDDFWWMGMMPKAVNNWNPWILSNTMAALVVWTDNDRRLAQGLTRAIRLLEAYVVSMPADGGCDEGASYWNMAGGSLLDCLEVLRHATGGQVSFYQHPLIRNIGAFPLQAHIGGPYYWNFADCDAMPILDGERVYTYGVHTCNPALMALGAAIAAQTSGIIPRDTPEMTRVLNRLFNPMPTQGAETCPVKRGVILPDLQVWAREREGLYVALKGGHNDESHNHNDVGSFLLYVDGQPAIIDVGNLGYTAKTFGPDRYTLWNTRSQNHNLPLIGGVEQAAGRAYAAQEVAFAEDEATLAIGGAYPPEAGVRQLRRSMGWQAGQWVLTDEIALDRVAPVTWVFMLREKPQIKDGRAICPKVAIAFDPTLMARAEEIPVQDRRMARNFPGSVWRLTLEATPDLSHRQVFHLGRG